MSVEILERYGVSSEEAEGVRCKKAFSRMKKSLIFVSHPLVCGGVERALLSVLSFLSEEKFDITLLLTEKSGALLGEVPTYVRILEVPFASLDRYELKHGRVPALKYCLLHLHWIRALRMLGMRFAWAIGGRKDNYNLRVIRDMMKRVDVKRMPTQSDFAFAYAGGVLIGSIVHDLIHASVTAIWCHNENEIGLMKSNVYDALHAHFTHRFATGQMASRLNEVLKERTSYYESLPYYVDPDLYRRMAESDPGFTDSYEGLRILTVGRLSHQKGIDEAIRMAVRLKTEGLKFRWYVVGDGEEHEILQRQIDEANIGKQFILLGQKLNPYPFFRECDIYAQPSRWEAFCLTLAEAKVFRKPIIVTDFVGAREQIQDGKTGLIVPLGDYETFYLGIVSLLSDAELRERLKGMLLKENTDSTLNALESWRELLGVL